MVGKIIGYKQWTDLRKNIKPEEKKEDKTYFCIHEENQDSWVGDVGTILQIKDSKLKECGFEVSEEIIGLKVLIDTNTFNGYIFGNHIVKI